MCVTDGCFLSMADRESRVGFYRPKTEQTEKNSDNRNETKKPEETRKNIFLAIKTTNENTNVRHMI